MPRSPKSLVQMNADGLRYLAENTDITYLSEGSMARSLMEASNLEVSRVQEYIAANYANVFINSAQGTYLDLIGEMLGVGRLPKRSASVTAEDQNVQLSAPVGTLGEKFPNPSDLNTGLIPAGLTIRSADSSIKYKTPEAITFPAGLTEVFISVVADTVGQATNVGKGKLVLHDGPSGVNVTNLKSITNGADVETDKEYKFRLSNAIASTSTSNETSVRLALAGLPGLADIQLKEHARGAGTFDVLLVPANNILSSSTSDLAQRAVESVSAFGVSPIVREPMYKKFRLSIQLIPASGVGPGAVDANKLVARNAVLDYFETIPMGGELIINRLRAAIIGSVTNDIKDIKLVDICINGRPKSIRNIKLKSDEVFIPDPKETPAVVIV